MIALVSVLLLGSIGFKGSARKTVFILLLFVCGICWAVFMANRQLHFQLPDHLDKRDFIVTGIVSSLIDSNDRRSRFSLDVSSATLVSDASQVVPLRSLLLSWYPIDGAALHLAPGERWQLVVRLRRPRGMRNPGAFDYQSWLIQQGYSATGYVRQADKALLLEPTVYSVNYYRSQIRRAINTSGLSEIGSAVLVALSSGDKQKISAHWDDLARLGIVHLLVISGLHIGLVGAMGFFIGTVLGRGMLPLHRRLPAFTCGMVRYAGPVAAMLLAGGYSLLAGFSLPTQRALIGVVVVMLSKLIFRRIAPFACMVWALVLIAISQH